MLCWNLLTSQRRASWKPERRQVTVLFTDMVGFTTFSERSGEEAAFTLMRSLSKLMDDAVREQGGVVQSFTGDGIMAVFGAPVAFEDAPLRACRAALCDPATAQGPPDLILRANTACDRSCASVSTPERRWSARCRTVPTPALRFSATR